MEGRKVAISIIILVALAAFLYASNSVDFARMNKTNERIDKLENKINELSAKSTFDLTSIRNSVGKATQEESSLEKNVQEITTSLKEMVKKLDTLEKSTISDLKMQVETLKAQVSSLEELKSSSKSSASYLSTQMQQAKSTCDLSSEQVPPALRLYGSAPPNKPSLIERKPSAKRNSIYDGAIDAPHLGGSTKNDTMGQSPALWTYLLKNINVKSVVDVGCGRGISSKWFLDHNADTLCIEGSKDAIKNTYMPEDRIVEHDFTLGPYWPNKTYDLAWSVEFVEHVGRHYMKNYMPIFHKSALIFITHSAWGGHHHVEVHTKQWWQARMTMQGFVFSAEWTAEFRRIAKESRADGFNSQHLWLNGLFFINPKIASLPKHAHLMGEPGCFPGRDKPQVLCSNADELPEQFLPVFRTPTKWDSMNAKSLNLPGAACRDDYGFPTGHDGCKDINKQKGLLRRLSDVVTDFIH